MGNAERALFFFRRYLESKPTGGPGRRPRASSSPQLEETVAAEKAKAPRVEGAARQLELEKARLAAAKAEADAAEKRRPRRRARRGPQAEEEAARKQALEAALTAPPPPPVVEEVPAHPPLVVLDRHGHVVAAVAGAAVSSATAPQATPTTFPDINAR